MPSLFAMKDQKQAHKTYKQWANLEWAKRHEFHTKEVPRVSCPFCFPPEKQEEGK